MHRDATETGFPSSCPAPLLEAAKQAGETGVRLGEIIRLSECSGHRAGPHGNHRVHDGLRHTGVDRYRQREVSCWRVRDAQAGESDGSHGAARLGYTDHQVDAIIESIEARDTIERRGPGLKEEHLPVFDCAFKPKNGKRYIPYSPTSA